MIVAIGDWETGKAGFVEFVEHERPEKILGIYKNHFGFWNHKIGDNAAVKAHDSGNASTVFFA